MADEIRLVTYANQQVTPQNDAVLTNLETPNNGIIFGCEISIKNASTLHINSGMGVIYGREFEIVDSDISVPLPGAGTELGQLYIHIDLANTSTPAQLLVETGASLTPMVDDANLNVTTGITEYQLATFNVSTATISDLAVTFENTKDVRTELGTADISGIGDGSVKGAISQINSDLSDLSEYEIGTVQRQSGTIGANSLRRYGNTVNIVFSVSGNTTPIATSVGIVPSAFRPSHDKFGTLTFSQGSAFVTTLCKIASDGAITCPFASPTTTPDSLFLAFEYNLG